MDWGYPEQAGRLDGAGDAVTLRTWPEWRNGRRARLKIWCPKGRVGSSPTSGTWPGKLAGLSLVFPHTQAGWDFRPSLLAYGPRQELNLILDLQQGRVPPSHPKDISTRQSYPP